MRNMSYRNHYSGSPWQQGGPPFGVGNYGQNYGGYNDQYPMMNAGYGRNQGGYGGMYGSGGMGQMRTMGYGGPSPSRHYVNDRMGGGGRQMMSRGQMQRKRLPQRSPAGGPRSKRPNLGGDSRRMSKPRRRRESRGGSKGRGRDHSEDDEEAYNPAEPTDDISDIDCVDGFESWKSSEEDEELKGEQKTVAKENGEQNLEENADENKDDGAKSAQKKLICYVCKVTCSTEEKYRKHQNSKSHTSKIDELVSIRRGKRQGTQEEEKGSDKETKDGAKKKSRKPGNWCTVCECAFSGNFLAHRRTKEHRKKRDKKYPKCRPCRLGFSSSEEYRDHYKSEEHKQKSAEFHYLKGLASGSDDDEAAIQPAKIELEEEVKNEEMKTDDVVAVDDVSKDKKTDSESIKTETNTEALPEGDNQEKKEQDKKDAEGKTQETKKKPREPKALGQSFVISVQGYYCKLCRKFFKDVTVAKSKHCRSVMHTGAYKKAMEEALEQEEERQKLAEEQDKLDREAAEAAELAADIAAVERDAKEAVKREAAKKKAEMAKGQDTEMKEVENEASKDDAKLEEKMDTTVTDQKMENGIKDQIESEQSPKDVKEEEKIPEEKAAAEAQEESPDGEDEGDEEQEKAKEEVTTSPATRRGRGRGRGRKRR